MVPFFSHCAPKLVLVTPIGPEVATGRWCMGVVSWSTYGSGCTYTLDDSVVLHVFTSGSMFSLLKSNLALILSRFSVATLHAHS